MKRHRNTREIHVINDRYDFINNVKEAEHQTRSEKFAGVTKNILIKSNDKLPSKTDLSSFFKNPGNKIRIQEFPMECFQNYISTNEEEKNLEFYYALREKYYSLKTKYIVNVSIYSHHTWAILYCSYISLVDLIVHLPSIITVKSQYIQVNSTR